MIVSMNIHNSASMISKYMDLLRHTHSWLALTGAGISQASGLPLLSGDMQGIPVAKLFESQLFLSNPNHYWELYREAYRKWRLATPNAAHIGLALHGAKIITQNVDGLHRDAGSKNLVELHGNLQELHCKHCQQFFPSIFTLRQPIPRCPTCNSALYPGIVFVGEEIRNFSVAVDWAGQCEILLIIGTSLSSEPVRQIPRIAEKSGATVFQINDWAQMLVPKFAASVGGA
ncbi:hypothetical protein D2Q93_15420 [Alicyclobacillaceae bacterium I2511]|nr:hypothetical protein D2Q93_15420 [Alicyclobacillaceae bacterium I2511]